MRKEFMARFDEGAARNMNVAPPATWPEHIQARIGETMGERLDFLGIRRDDAAGRQKVNANNYRFFGAPVVVFFCYDKTLGPWSMFDLGAVTQSVMLAAQEYGIDSGEALNFAAFPDIIREELGIPENLSIVIGIALGHADKEDLRSRVISPRRPNSDVIRLIGF
jgi:nitroreductase